MRKLIYLLALWAPTMSAQCDAVITDFNWETYTATIDVDCEEGLTDICLYLGNAELDDIPPCGNFSQNINWPEYTFTFFDVPMVTQGTIELNIFDAWNNSVANPYTIAECWVQYYEEGFLCEGEVGIWQMNLGGNLLGYSSVEFGGPCPDDCDPIIEYVYITDTIYIELPPDTIETYIDNYIYLTDTVEIINETLIYVYDTTEVVIDNYIYLTDTIILTEYVTYYIDCETGESCDEDGVIDGCVNNSIFVPNVFTPNNDGVNDIFYAVTEESCWLTWEMKVYNRWGGLVWESLDPSTYWQGQSRSGHWLVIDGVYTWTIRATAEGRSKELSGHVTVVR